MNQFVVSSLSRIQREVEHFSAHSFHSSDAQPKIYEEHPTSSSESIFAALDTLSRKRFCSKIVVLGEQCKAAAQQFLLQPHFNKDVAIYMVNDPAVSSDDDVITRLDRRKLGHWYKDLYSLNFRENDTGYSLGAALSVLQVLRQNNSKERHRIAIIGAASVPIILDWISGIRDGYEKSTDCRDIRDFTIGSGYSKFDDARSAYELTKYLIEVRGFDCFVQICGASSSGVTAAIREHAGSERDIAYVPLDNPDWTFAGLSAESIPFGLVRSIDKALAGLLEASSVTQENPPKLATLYYRDVLGKGLEKTLRELPNNKLEGVSIERWQ